MKMVKCKECGDAASAISGQCDTCWLLSRLVPRRPALARRLLATMSDAEPNKGLRHVNCGGLVVEDLSKVYEHEGSSIPAQRCISCCAEILGDREVYIAEEA